MFVTLGGKNSGENISRYTPDPDPFESGWLGPLQSPPPGGILLRLPACALFGRWDTGES